MYYEVLIDSRDYPHIVSTMFSYVQCLTYVCTCIFCFDLVHKCTFKSHSGGCTFLRVLCFPPPWYNWNIVENGVKHHKLNPGWALKTPTFLNVLFSKKRYIISFVFHLCDDHLDLNEIQSNRKINLKITTWKICKTKTNGDSLYIKFTWNCI